MTAKQIREKEDQLFWYFIAISCFVLVFVVGAYFMAIAAKDKKPEGPGEFGDLFGTRPKKIRFLLAAEEDSGVEGLKKKAGTSEAIPA